MKNLISIFLLILLVSCSNTEQAVIPQDKMVDVIYDLTVSSSARNTANRRDTLQYVVSYEQILKKHGIDSLQFVKAQKAYQQNPELYTAIYDSVIHRLQKQLEEVRKTKPAEEEQIAPVVNFKEIPFSRRKNQ
ncbi:DUF4296 domain-containing protein [Flavobacterium sp. CBA20B-1]|uniref:DUF4296 domain-containing protein n=1 Tax=unclassified Flavobacterium TaxID=196869 RepID=UPI002224FBB8|nr:MULTISPECIES: DUF4296 domain-containing protein [unclassified Flavobacterium]WCM43390.1 DUF4296 domain-containing protein [Flavobacterium sp. CBA20B-1]